MDSVYFFHTNITAASTLGLTSNWNSILFNTSNIIGGPLATTVYQCYLFFDNVETYTNTRLS